MLGYRSASGSVAEDLFIELFSDVFGAEKAGYLYSQYHFFDIYQNSVMRILRWRTVLGEWLLKLTMKRRIIRVW